MTTDKRTAVVSLESLIWRLEELTKRAYDHDDRCTDQTDRDVRIELSTWMTVADNSVWGSATDYDDEAALEKLQRVCEDASRAWRYLYYLEPEWVVQISDDPELPYFGFVREDGKVTSENLKHCWTARTEKRAEQYAADLRTRYNLPAKALMFTGEQMKKARAER